MKDKILKLCKRLKKCSLNELIQFLEVDTSKIATTLNELIEDKYILFVNGYYFAQDKPIPKIESHCLSKMVECISDEKFDLIIKSFCIGIPNYKMSLLLNISENSSKKYYDVFRTFIYNRQLVKLKEMYSKEPRICRSQNFFEQTAYFYIYQNIVYVSDKKLFSGEEKRFTKSEIIYFKKIYCYLSRLKTHNRNAENLKYKLAEALWRREKEFEELYYDLKNNLCLI